MRPKTQGTSKVPLPVSECSGISPFRSHRSEMCQHDPSGNWCPASSLGFQVVLGPKLHRANPGLLQGGRGPTVPTASPLDHYMAQITAARKIWTRVNTPLCSTALIKLNTRSSWNRLCPATFPLGTGCAFTWHPVSKGALPPLIRQAYCAKSYCIGQIYPRIRPDLPPNRQRGGIHTLGSQLAIPTFPYASEHVI